MNFLIMSYEELLLFLNIDEEDVSKKALFYIISNSIYLLERFEDIYDIEAGEVKFESIKNGDFAEIKEADLKLLYFGLNLYNGYTDPSVDITIHSLLKDLNYKEYRVVLNAIDIRYSNKFN